MLRMKVEGIAHLQRMLPRADGAVYNTSKDTVQTATARCTTSAKALCPVGETGRLQKSIGMMMMKAVGFVGIKSDDRRWATPMTGSGRVALLSPTIYWRYPEFGTVKAPAQPFFRPAAERTKGPFVAAMAASGPKIERAI